MVGWVAAERAGRAGDEVHAALRRDARTRTARSTSPTCAARPTRHLLARGRRRRGVRAALHLPRLPLRRGRPAIPAKPAPDAITGVRGPHRHAADRRVRVLERAGQPALAQHRLGPARQLPLGARPTARSATSGSAGSRDAQVFAPTASLNMDVAAFMTKWGDDVLDAQSPEGAYPDVAPRLVVERDGAPAWGDAGVIVPWSMYRRYGDRRLLERHWDAMERYMATCCGTTRTCCGRSAATTTTATGCRSAPTRRRTCSPRPTGPTTRALMARDRATCSASPRARGALPTRCATGIVAAFNRAFVGADGAIAGDTQTVYLLALHMDLIPDDAAAARRRAAGRGHRAPRLAPPTGFVGVGLLCPVLTEAGRADVAHRLLLTETFPSWGYSIRHGATTIWERWDGWTEHGGFQTAEHELVQPLLARLRRRVAVRVRRRHPLRPRAVRLRARARRAGAGRAGVRAGDVRVRARADHERLAPHRRCAPPRRRDPGERHRHGRAPGRPGRSPRAAGTPRTPRACARSAGRLPRSRRRSARGATRSRSRVTRPAPPAISGREFRHFRPLLTPEHQRSYSGASRAE